MSLSTLNPFMGPGHSGRMSKTLYWRLTHRNEYARRLKEAGFFCINGTPDVPGGKQYALWYIAGLKNQKELERFMDMRDKDGVLLPEKEMPYGPFWKKCHPGSKMYPQVKGFDKSVADFGEVPNVDGREGETKKARWWRVESMPLALGRNPTTIVKALEAAAEARAAQMEAEQQSPPPTRSGGTDSAQASQARAAAAAEESNMAAAEADEIQAMDCGQSEMLPERSRSKTQVTPGSKEHAEALVSPIIDQAKEQFGTRGEPLEDFVWLLLRAFMSLLGVALLRRLWERGAQLPRLWGAGAGGAQAAVALTADEIEAQERAEVEAYAKRKRVDQQQREGRNGRRGIGARVNRAGHLDVPTLKENIAIAEEVAPTLFRKHSRTVASDTVTGAEKRAKEWIAKCRAGKSPAPFQVHQRKSAPSFTTIDAVQEEMERQWQRYQLHALRSLDRAAARRYHSHPYFPRHIFDSLVTRSVAARATGMTRGGMQRMSAADDGLAPTDIDELEKVAAETYAKVYLERVVAQAVELRSLGVVVDNYVPCAINAAGNSARANAPGQRSLNNKAHTGSKSSTAGMSDGVTLKTSGLDSNGDALRDSSATGTMLDFDPDRLRSFLKGNYLKLRVGLAGELSTVMKERLEKVDAADLKRADGTVVVKKGALKEACAASQQVYATQGGLSLTRHTGVIPNAYAKSSKRVDYVRWVLKDVYGKMLREVQKKQVEIDLLSCTDTEYKNHLAVCLRAVNVGTLNDDEAEFALSRLVETPQIMHTCQGLLRCAFSDQTSVSLLWAPIVGDLYKFSQKKFVAFRRRIEKEAATARAAVAAAGEGDDGDDDDGGNDDDDSLMQRLVFNGREDYTFADAEDPAAQMGAAIIAAATAEQEAEDAREAEEEEEEEEESLRRSKRKRTKPDRYDA